MVQQGGVPVPRLKKKGNKGHQGALGLSDARGVSTTEQECIEKPIINEIRGFVDAWRSLPNPNVSVAATTSGG